MVTFVNVEKQMVNGESRGVGYNPKIEESRVPSTGAEQRRRPSAEASARPFDSPEKRNVLRCLFLVLITLAIYNPVSHHPFVNYDDPRYVTDNAHIKSGLGWGTVKWAFTSYEEANWHPVTWFSHALDYELFRLNPAGHHYTNVLLHTLNVLLLFWLLHSSTRLPGRSFMVAALFALHPINVESVAWISERKNLLSMLFFLLALHAYGRYARKPSVPGYLSVLMLFGLGLMSKPQVITLPFVLLLWDYWPLGRMFSDELPNSATGVSLGRSFLWLVYEKVPLLALSAVSAFITLKAQEAGGAVTSLANYPRSIRMQNAVVSYAHYLSKAIWPSRLAPMYPHPVNSLNIWLVLGASLTLAMVTGLVIAYRRKRYLVMGWFWFMGTLVPMIGLVQVGSQAMADRYAYLPFIGLFIAICWEVTNRSRHHGLHDPYLAGVSALVLVTLVAITHRQIDFWSGDLTLWSHTLQVTSDNFIAEDSLGGALLEDGRLDEAMPHFRRAASIHPSDPISNLNIAFDMQQHGQLGEAVEQYKSVLGMTNDARMRANVYTNLGNIYRNLSDSKNARESFESAVRLRPRAVRAWLGLGLVAEKTHDFNTAIYAYSQVLAIQPSDVAYLLLAHALEQTGRNEESQFATQQARLLSQDFDDARKIADGLAH